jgi:hypothetical protein
LIVGSDSAEAAVFRLQPTAPVRRGGVADVGHRRPTELAGGGIPHRIRAVVARVSDHGGRDSRGEIERMRASPKAARRDQAIATVGNTHGSPTDRTLDKIDALRAERDQLKKERAVPSKRHANVTFEEVESRADLAMPEIVDYPAPYHQ